MSEEEKNNIGCQCCICLEEKATWTIVYGTDPPQDYTFTCTLCIGKMIEYLTSESKKAKRFTTFYAERYDSKNSFNEEWNEQWKKHFNICLEQSNKLKQ